MPWTLDDSGIVIDGIKLVVAEIKTPAGSTIAWVDCSPVDDERRWHLARFIVDQLNEHAYDWVD